MTNTPVSPVVEMLIGGVWTDVTEDVRLSDADSGGGIHIKRGVPNEGNSAEPTEVDFVLNNRDGKYSPKNPYSPNFGLLGRNTPVRFGVSRQRDTFVRSEADSWGRLPVWFNTEGQAVLGERWNLTGPATRFDIIGSAGQITSGSGHSVASFGTYADAEILCKVRVSDRTSEFGVVMRAADTRVGDTDFESGLAGWTASGGTSTLVTATTFVHTGTTSALLTVAGSPASASARHPGATVTPGDVYKVRCWVRCSISTNVIVGISWRDAGGSTVATTTNTVAVTSGVWTVIEAEGAAPDAAASAIWGPTISGSPANGTLLFIDDVEFLNSSETAYYNAYVTPGGTDQLRLGGVARTWAFATSQNMATNVVADEWYWFRAQATGIRRRVKFWKDGDPEPVAWNWRTYEERLLNNTEPRPPLVGQFGVYVKDGSATVTYGEVTVTVWRAHAEIQKLPQKWDLSRQDRWVPVSARGPLQRLGQGRKSLESPVTLHLQAYPTSRMWIPFEQFDESSGTIGNRISNAPPAAARDVSQSSVDASGVFAAPGLVACVSVDQDTSFLSARVVPGAPNGIWSFLTFLRVPNTTAASALLYTIECTGTARYFRVWYTASSSVLIEALTADGTVLSSSTAAMYFGTAHPQGCWLAANLYVFQSGGTVFWAWNFHRPGGTSFFTINGSYSGSAGQFTSVRAQGSSTLTTAGGVQFAHWFHYPGDLPFVDDAFARAAYAYIGEAAGTRFLRLLGNAGEKAMTTGFSSVSKATGAQTPSKLLDLLQECAEVDDAVVMESRDDLELSMRTRESMYNQVSVDLHIDRGELFDPLDPAPDDQNTRNDVTVSRPNGGLARSVAYDGPLNVNPPEQDPDGVGTYDEAPEINYASDDQLLPAANWRRAKGTNDVARYPTIRVDLAGSAYQDDPALTARVLGLDSGDMLGVWNSEVEYQWNRQQIQGYTEFIDQYDHEIKFVGAPGNVRSVGQVGRSTRLQTRYHATSGVFAAGTDTLLSSARTLPGALWVQVKDAPESFPFVVEASGVQLRVLSVGRVLNQNPYFESGIAGYQADGSVTLYWDRYPFQYVTSPGSSAPGSLRMTATSGGNGGAVATAAAQAPVAASTDYQVSAWMMGSAAIIGCGILVDWYNASSVFISTTTPATISFSAGYVWRHYAETVTSPVGAAFARIRPRAFLAPGQIFWVDDLRLMPVSSFSASPQTLQVEQVPVNGVVKSIPDGSPITVVDPWRIAF